MDIENIFDIFCRLAELDKDSSVRLLFLCEGAMRYVMHRLTDPAAVECGGRTEYAAAALAYYRYVILSLTDGGAGEIKVGDITVKQNGCDKAEAAESGGSNIFESIANAISDLWS